MWKVTISKIYEKKSVTYLSLMCLACYTSLSTRGYSNVKCERMLIISSAQSNGTTEEGQISELVNFVQL